MKNDIFDRRTTSEIEISSHLFNLYLGMTLCWGFLVNWYIVQTVDPMAVLVWGYWPFLIAYFICCFGGIYLFNSSEKPLVSFIGYNLVVVPFGLVVNIVVSRYDTQLVLDAVQVTGLVTFIMMVMGSLFPKFFQKIHTALGVALFAVIIVELITVFFFKKDLEIIDWIVVLIFCGYIGYDWGRANRVPKTLDNAIDCAAALYMDIINLFLRILRIMGRRG